MIFGCVSLAGAEPKLSFEVGWDGKFRSGRWTPIYVTLSDAFPREVVMEVQAPYDRRYQIILQQGLTIGPAPITVPIYVPLNQSLQETRIALTTPGGRRLVNVPLEEDSMTAPVNRMTSGIEAVNPAAIFAGLSGSQATEGMVETQLGSDRVSIAYLRPERLPAVSAGYEALDVLILNQPDLNRLASDQQQAIMQWVRGGGNLVMWPGPEPVPVTSPIVDALPARIGENRNYSVDVKLLKSAGLTERFATLKGRTLMPMAGAVNVELFKGSKATAYRARAGYGQIVILPIDASLLRFDSSDTSEAFWRKALSGVIAIPQSQKSDENNPNPYNNRYYGNALDSREQSAMTATLNWMGSIPGAGTFGFSYIAGMLIVMMVVVGPVDWFVLKWMGRQPWTWVTTAGWAGLITAGAIFIGHVFKSGELHFRTTSIVDEADGMRVASTDVAAIYSPRTRKYELECDPEGWWRPASEVVGWSGGGGLKVDIPCHQDYRGNRPLPLRVNVWNLRFLAGTSHALRPAMIEAKLIVKYDSELKKRIVSGTITNRGAQAMTNVLVRLSDGVAKASGRMGAGETIEMNAPLIAYDKTFQVTHENQQYYGGRSQDPGPMSQPGVAKVSDLAGARSDRVEKLLSQYRGTACVYAECSAPPDTVKLEMPEAKRVHHQVIRSLVHVERLDATPKLTVVKPATTTRATTRPTIRVIRPTK